MTPSSPPSYTFLDTQPYPLLTSLASKLPNSSTNIPHQTSSPTAPPITDPNQSPTHTGPNSPGPTFPTNQPTSHEPNNIQTQTQNNPLPPPIFDPPNPQTNTNPVNEPPRTHPMITRSQSGIVKPIERLSLHTSSLSPIPKSPFIALKDPNWCNAMYDEYNALVKNGTWILVPRPSDVNLVRSMWLFKHKFHADGTLSRYKARLVANGSNQQHGVDFDETFSPVVKPATIRTVLSLAVSRQWPIHQLDVKNAFLNGDLSETVYMHQPPGFVDSRYPNHVCLLQRSLYGLKQAPRAWFQRFAGYATRAGFSPSRCDSSLFIYTQGSQVAYLLIYVDDIILTASSPVLLQQIVDSLHKEFDMTDLGALNYFLGISAVRHPTGLFLSQKKYARQLLERAHMVNCNPSRTPIDTDSKLGPDGVPVQDPTLYRSLAGGLQYLTFTRPDLSYAVQQHKFHADGTLSRYKARLVANCSSQQLGVDFNETFSPVVKPATIHTVLSLAMSRKWPIHQLDVKNVFLNDDLSEIVYMYQPPSFVDARFLIHVCRLQRSLYGLKQAPRAWFQHFAGYATRAGFYHSRCDSSLFIYRQGSQVAYLLLYVDDIILMASSTALLQQLIDSLHREFDMTDLGALNYFLGISDVRHSTCLFLSQRKYALQLLDRAHMVNCNPSRTPVDTKSKLGPNGVPVQDLTMYRSLARGLQYLMFTRPDLSYAIQQICLYMHDPREPHLAALKRILRYVQGTLDLGLHLYASFTTSLVGYTNADWACCPSTRRSTSGYYVFLGDNLLSWSAKRQHTLLRSSTESEYRGVANVVAETAWLRNLLRELNSPLSTATLVYYDNVSAVYMSANPVQHQRTKHIEIDIHFVRDMVTAGQVRVLHVPSRYQYADIFTKGLPSALFEEFWSSLSVHPPPALTTGAY
ncbi:ribonuclease H-like domain-containing protein [Tanacetum coccineum]